MDDSSHDQDHIYRVLYTALDIARTLPNVRVSNKNKKYKVENIAREYKVFGFLYRHFRKNMIT